MTVRVIEGQLHLTKTYLCAKTACLIKKKITKKHALFLTINKKLKTRRYLKTKQKINGKRKRIPDRKIGENEFYYKIPFFFVGTKMYISHMIYESFIYEDLDSGLSLFQTCKGKWNLIGIEKVRNRECKKSQHNGPKGEEGSDAVKKIPLLFIKIKDNEVA